MGSVAQKKTASAPHTFVGGIEGKVCGSLKYQVRANAAMGCKQWRALGEYRSNSTGYEDGLDGICAKCRRDAAALRDAEKAKAVPPPAPEQGKKQSQDFDRTEMVVVRGIGPVKIGWQGNAQYWPLKPLKRLMNTAWPNVQAAIKADPLLASVSMLFISTGVDDKRYEMLCLPWSHWHSFWLKFGSNETRQVQEDAQRVLARAFGSTAEQVQQQTARARSGSIPLIDLDLLRKHRRQIEELHAADDRVAQAAQDAEQDLERARSLKAEADRLLSEAKDRQRVAHEAEQVAQRRIEDAKREQEQIEKTINRLLGQDAEWVYDFGRESDKTPMYVSGKFGDTGNPPQRRKQLRQGDSRSDFRIKRPCDNAEGVADQMRRYIEGVGGSIRGNDGYDGLPTPRYNRMIGVLQEHEYIEVEWFTRWVSQEIGVKT